MSKLPDIPTYEFRVWTLPVGLGSEVLNESDPIEAAYFQEQGVYTLFKDGCHVVVEALKTELVTRIVRSEEPVD